MEERIVVVDTDAGIDDAIAVFMSLRAHKDPSIPWKVVAITCVNGNTGVDNVCINVTRVLQTAGATEIPVFRGAEKSIVETPVRTKATYHGDDGFGDVLPKITPKLEKEHAVLALIRLAKEYEGKLTVIAIGPLTNIALAMNLDPSFSKSIKELCIMGGNVGGMGNISACAEFNFWADPDAAYITLQGHFRKPILLVPWETCKFETRFSIEQRRNKVGALGTVESDLLNKIEENILIRNQNTHGGWVSCDALVPAVLLNEKVTKTTVEHFCTVETHGYLSRGLMIVDHPRLSDKKDNVNVVTKVDIDEYEKMLIWGLGGPNFK